MHLAMAWRISDQSHSRVNLSDDNFNYHFTLGTFTPLMRLSGLKTVNLSTFCVSWLDDTLGPIVTVSETLFLESGISGGHDPGLLFRAL